MQPWNRDMKPFSSTRTLESAEHTDSKWYCWTTFRVRPTLFDCRRHSPLSTNTSFFPFLLSSLVFLLSSSSETRVRFAYTVSKWRDILKSCSHLSPSSWLLESVSLWGRRKVRETERERESKRTREEREACNWKGWSQATRHCQRGIWSRSHPLSHSLVLLLALFSMESFLFLTWISQCFKVLSVSLHSDSLKCC